MVRSRCTCFRGTLLPASSNCVLLPVVTAWLMVMATSHGRKAQTAAKPAVVTVCRLGGILEQVYYFTSQDGHVIFMWVLRAFRLCCLTRRYVDGGGVGSPVQLSLWGVYPSVVVLSCMVRVLWSRVAALSCAAAALVTSGARTSTRTRASLHTAGQRTYGACASAVGAGEPPE